jgi:hypothetical protein
MATENKEAISIINVPKYFINLFFQRRVFRIPVNPFKISKQIYDIDTSSLALVDDLKINESNQHIAYATSVFFMTLERRHMSYITERLLTILVNFKIKTDAPEKLEKHLHPKELSRLILISYALSQYNMNMQLDEFANRFLTTGIQNSFDTSKEFISVIKILIEAGWDELLEHNAIYFSKQEYYENMLQSCLKFSDHKNNVMKHIIIHKFSNIKKQSITVPDGSVRSDIIRQDFYMDSNTPSVFEELYKLYDEAKDEMTVYNDVCHILKYSTDFMMFMECIRLRNEIKRLNDTKCKSEKNANDLKN